MADTVKPIFDPIAAEAANQSLQTLDFELASIDEIKELIKPILRGYLVNALTTSSGNHYYQVSVGEKPRNISDLSYPPDKIAKIGLAHRPGEQVFYAYPTRQVAFIESGAKVGDTLAIASLVATAALDVNHAGYTQSSFDALHSQRPLPCINATTPFVLPTADQHSVNFVASAFAPTQEDAERRHNKLTVALVECLLNGKPPLQGIMYPSTAFYASVDNIILTSEAAKTLRFEKAEFIKIDSFDKDENKYHLTILDTAPELSPRGAIEWYGGRVGEPSKRYGTIGWEEFLRQKKDILSAYDSAKEANANRPMQIEHGNVGEAKLRSWLSESLPKKYGVTSGFIIPNSRVMNYQLRHYDVIIYDYLNSPVLWASNNPDDSEQGRARAIPAEFVHAVFEVKATFTKQSADDALQKLEELNLYKDHLTEKFISGIVFFEVKQEHQSKSELAGQLYKENIPGYYGGLILRAEGMDTNVAGYYKFQDAEYETPGTMPLVRDIDSFGRNSDGSIGIAPGNRVTASNQDQVWNFDMAYSVQVEQVDLCWSYNSFPYFFRDLILMLDGGYDAIHSSNKSNYGLSFIRHGAIVPNSSILGATQISEEEFL